MLFAGIGAAQGLPPAPVVAILLVNTVLVGFSEEVMFRGFLYSGLRDRLRPWPAIWAVTLLFGALHTLNALVTGHLLDALQQSGNATLIGLALLAIRLRTGSIWPAVLVHASWDFGLLLLAQASGPPPPDLQLSLAQRALATLPILPLGLWGLWLLRGVGRDGDGLGPPARRWHQTAPARVGGQAARSVMQQGVRTMADASQIREHAEVIGADGVHIGTVDKVEGDRIKLTKQDSGLGHTDHHHYLPLGLVAEVEGDTVRLSANAAVAAEMFEEEEDGKPLD
nr:DUF2171 domain-containing protein [Rubellimicrobium aerolatum]